MLQIRKFQPQDMFSVIKIANETLTERYNPNIFNYFYETFPYCFWVAEENHRIIGFIMGAETDQENAKILMLSVKQSVRRKKIGSALLNQFLNEMIEKNKKNVYLEVRENNLEAKNFYKKNGFKIISRMDSFYQDGTNAYIMKKKL